MFALSSSTDMILVIIQPWAFKCDLGLFQENLIPSVALLSDIICMAAPCTYTHKTQTNKKAASPHPHKIKSKDYTSASEAMNVL